MRRSRWVIWRRSGSGKMSGPARASRKTRPGIRNIEASDVAVTVAVRARPRSRPISPNESFGPMRFTTPCAAVATSNVPDRTVYRSSGKSLQRRSPFPPVSSAGWTPERSAPTTPAMPRRKCRGSEPLGDRREPTRSSFVAADARANAGVVAAAVTAITPPATIRPPRNPTVRINSGANA